MFFWESHVLQPYVVHTPEFTENENRKGTHMKQIKTFLVFLAMLTALPILNCADTSQENEGEKLALVLIASELLKSDEPANTDCTGASSDINNPTSVTAGTVTATVAHGKNCYFKYTATATVDPSFSANYVSGNPDLYVAVANDADGGTNASITCSDWEGCSVTSGAVSEIVSAASLASINSGDFRIIAVYGDRLNDEAVSTEFELMITE